jgi:CheY-like chemotaxis protein
MYKVLIVEDDEHLLRMYSRIFRFKGYHVIGVANGQEALNLATTHVPDVILLDVMVPHFDGFKILSLLKENPRTQACTVVMLTNLSDPYEQEKSYQHGAALYLVKNDHEPLSLFPLIHKFVEKDYTE